jgi:hypothetical protein
MIKAPNGCLESIEQFLEFVGPFDPHPLCHHLSSLLRHFLSSLPQQDDKLLNILPIYRVTLEVALESGDRSIKLGGLGVREANVVENRRVGTELESTLKLVSTLEKVTALDERHAHLERSQGIVARACIGLQGREQDNQQEGN